MENQRTQERLRTAEDVGTAREHFLAVVAHDLRNRLQTIKAASALLVRGADPAKVRKRLAASAGRMTRLIDDLVDFTKGCAGSLITVQKTPHADLAESLEAVVDEFRDSHVDRDASAVRQVGAHRRVICLLRERLAEPGLAALEPLLADLCCPAAWMRPAAVVDGREAVNRV